MRSPYALLALATAAYTVCFATWTLVGALAPLYREALRLSAVQTGWLVTVPVLAGALARLPVGMLADRFGAHRVLWILLALLSVPALLAGWSGSYGGLLAWGGLLGFSGAAFSAGLQYVSQRFPPERRGLALGIFGAGNAGAAFSAWFAPAASAAWGRSSVFLFYAATLAITAAAFALLGRPPAAARAPTGRAAFGALRSAEAWVLAYYFVVTFGGFLALSVHLPTVLVEAYGLSPEAAGRHVAVFALAGTLARPLGGYAADRLGATRILYAAFPGVAALALFLSSEPAHFAGTGVVFALGVTLGAGNGAVTKLIAEQFPRQVGSVSGLVGAAGSLGGLLLPLAQGLGQDLIGSYVFGFLVLAALASSALVLQLRRRHPHATRGE